MQRQDHATGGGGRWRGLGVALGRARGCSAWWWIGRRGDCGPRQRVRARARWSGRGGSRLWNPPGPSWNLEPSGRGGSGAARRWLRMLTGRAPKRWADDALRAIECNGKQQPHVRRVFDMHLRRTGLMLMSLA
eukprot:9465610-Pyramimonas_sp.AAC.1